MVSELKCQPELKHPSWIKVRLNPGEDFQRVDNILKKWSLHTVCREAICPNISECYRHRTVTLLILGDVCTRNCRFCGVKKGKPQISDSSEAERVAQAVKELGLRYVVITSVTRDDLPDGGATAFAQTIKAIKRNNPEIRVEVLIPDLRGSKDALEIIIHASPDVLGHNLETVPRLYSQVRPEANYERSLNLLKEAKKISSSLVTKSGLMVGLGESKDEVLIAMDDLRSVDCDILTIGQYLAPTRFNYPVKRYYSLKEFDEFIFAGGKRGLKWIESGPLVRSSFHAYAQWQKTQSNDLFGL
ncbi:MAG: lipoyl synthase [Desulfobacterota bacterium]|nr:lipoyl synthase [Thermodesulfobacteriota bacterium]